MIAKYKTKGDCLTVIGFLMAVGGRLVDVVCGDSEPGMLLMLSGLLELIGGVVFVIGCGFLAKAKGHHCVWGLLGILSLIGYFLLWLCLNDRTKQTSETGGRMNAALVAIAIGLCSLSSFAQWSSNTTYYNPNGSIGGSARMTQFGNSTQTTFYNANGSVGGSARTFSNGSGTQTTFYNSNGSSGGSAQTFRSGNTANTTYYNSNGSYGGSSRTTTFGNQSTTWHYGANGAPVGSSTTTTFGNQTTTRHYNQYGRPAGTTTRYNFGR